MGKKAKNFRAWLYQNPNGTIEDAWNAAWEGQNALQYSRTIQEKDAEIERLTLQRDAQAENATQYFDRANGLAIENKALRADNERLKADRDQGGKDYCALMDRHDEQHNEIEKLREAVKAGAKMIRWLVEHKDRMHAVAWLDALETAEMMEAALARMEDKP